MFSSTFQLYVSSSHLHHPLYLQHILLGTLYFFHSSPRLPLFPALLAFPPTCHSSILPIYHLSPFHLPLYVPLTFTASPFHRPPFPPLPSYRFICFSLLLSSPSSLSSPLFSSSPVLHSLLSQCWTHPLPLPPSHIPSLPPVPSLRSPLPLTVASLPSSSDHTKPKGHVGSLEPCVL